MEKRSHEKTMKDRRRSFSRSRMPTDACCCGNMGGGGWGKVEVAVVDTERWAKGMVAYGEGQVRVVGEDKKEIRWSRRMGRSTGR